MRIFWRGLAVLAIVSGTIFGLATSAQADSSEACRRSHIVADKLGPYQRIAAPSVVVEAAQRMCSSGDPAVARAVANNPLRSLGNTYTARSDKPCQGLADGTIDMQVQCVADWAEYIGFFGDRTQNCLNDYRGQASIHCYPQGAIVGFWVTLAGITIVPIVVAILWHVATTPGSPQPSQAPYDPNSYAARLYRENRRNSSHRRHPY